MVPARAQLSWLDVPVQRGVRDRTALGPVPRDLGLMGPEDQALLARWVRDDSTRRGRDALMKLARGDGIERAEALCEQLLRTGWITRRERLLGGVWQWQSLVWRDLETLKALRGVGSAAQRNAVRADVLQAAATWLAQRLAEAEPAQTPDPPWLDELTQTLVQLGADNTLKLEVLTQRWTLIQALADWHDSNREGTRRDFALHARGGTKAIGPADWKWLAQQFDLDRLRITGFAPMLWLAGRVALCWNDAAVDASSLHCVGIALDDVPRADALLARSTTGLQRYWLIENRASFERQARQCPIGTALIWMPGRPSRLWMDAVGHLLRLAPAPVWISADADPSGVDIALTVGALWRERDLLWSSHRMGADELAQSDQLWALNEHDRALLSRLLARADLPNELRALCEAMRQSGRKAEQEAWL